MTIEDINNHIVEHLISQLEIGNPLYQELIELYPEAKLFMAALLRQYSTDLEKTHTFKTR